MSTAPCVILVPGYKGSILTDGTRPVWITAREALFGKSSLAYDRPDLGIRNSLRLTNGPILEEIRVIPGLLRADIYRSTLRAMRSALPVGWEVRSWQYDWRRDAADLVDELDAFVSVTSDGGAREVRMLAHSMGAMLTAAWLLRPGAAAGAARGVTRVAFVAGAFRGATKYFRNLQTGDEPAGRNTTLLSADAMATFPSGLAFIPDSWPIVVDARGDAIAADFRDVALWERERWGIFRDGRADVAAARRAFLAERFLASRAFLAAIDDPAAAAPIGLRVHNAYGTGFGTIDQLIRRADGSLVLSERERARDPALASRTIEVPGDGTIAAHAAELPPALAARAVGPSVGVRAEHMAVVQRGQGLDASLRFLAALA
jgi:hypothetical protein